MLPWDIRCKTDGEERVGLFPGWAEQEKGHQVSLSKTWLKFIGARRSSSSNCSVVGSSTLSVVSKSGWIDLFVAIAGISGIVFKYMVMSSTGSGGFCCIFRYISVKLFLRYKKETVACSHQ